MGFGKKNKKKGGEPQAPQPKPVKVSMDSNPLYPPKTESEVKEILTALGTTVVCFVLVGLIFSNFSYAAGNYPSSYSNGGSSAGVSQNVPEEDEPGTSGSVGEDEPEDDVSEDDVPEASGTGDSTDPETDGTLNGNGIGKVIPEDEAGDEAEDADYIIADSNSRYVTTDDLDDLSKEELSRARNEIYARHGRKFKDEALQSYFDSKEWYNGTIAPDQFTEGMLNNFEKKNAETILSYEKSKGYR